MPRTTSHEPYEQLIEKRLHEPLTNEESAALAAHLAGCPECRDDALAAEENQTMLEHTARIAAAECDYDRIRRAIENRLAFFGQSARVLKLMLIGAIVALPAVALLEMWPAVYALASGIIFGTLYWRYVTHRRKWDALAEHAKDGDATAYPKYLSEARSIRFLLIIAPMFLAAFLAFETARYAIGGRWGMAIWMGVTTIVVASFALQRALSRRQRERDRALFEGRMTSKAYFAGRDPDEPTSGD